MSTETSQLPLITSQPALDARIASLPVTLADKKRASFQDYELLPMPKRKDENWRFSSVDKLSFDGFTLTANEAPANAEDLITRSNLIEHYLGKAVIAGDTTIQACNLPEELAAKGVIWCSLEEAFQIHADLVEKYFMKEVSGLGADKQNALHGALASNGQFLYVPKGVEMDQPVVTYYWAVGQNTALFPHTIVVAGDNATVKIQDIFLSDSPDTQNLAIANAHLFAGAGSHVFYKAVQNWNRNTQCYHLNTANAERDAEIVSVNINLGAHYMRHEHHTRIMGAGSNIETYSLSVPDSDQEFDQRTLQTHYAPNARSDLLFKNALFDQSRTIFSGLIKVEKDAQQTDAYQTNRNLLLSDVADANSLPGLEIEANDVKCSHGATSGQLDESNLFYFLARGIPAGEAKRLLTFGFFEEILDKLNNDELAESIRKILQSKFH